jgi:alpha-ribazole phosphatase
LADALGCGPVRFDTRLMEMDFGDWEMRLWNDIPRSEIEAWANDMTHYRPGGGESVAHMAERVRAFHQSVIEMRFDDAIVICHAGTIRLLLACINSLGVEEVAQCAAQTQHKISYGEVIILDL